MWRIMYVHGDYALTLRQGDERTIRSYYRDVYKEHQHVYLLLSPQEYNEMFVWDF